MTNEELRKIDISNLRFYARMANEFNWRTDVLHFGVIVSTLEAIADRLGAAVSASPQPNLQAILKDFVAKYARLNGVREQLATPKYDHYVEGASDFADELETQFFAAAPAQEPRKMIPHKGKESVCSHCGVKIYQAINKLWLTPFTQYRHCAGTANRNHEPTEPSAAAQEQPVENSPCTCGFLRGSSAAGMSGKPCPVHSPQKGKP